MSAMRSDIEEAIKWMNALQKASARREIKTLETKLTTDEVVERVAQGRYEGKEGLMVLTSQRVFFSEEGIARSRVEDFPLKSISTVQVETGLLAGTITLFASGNKAVIDNILPKQSAVAFVDALRERLAAAATTPSGAVAGPAGAQSPIEKLQRLAELRDAGVISAEEFEAKKSELLSQI